MNSREYLSSISKEDKEKIDPIFKYIEKEYSEAQFSDKYAENTKLPIYKLNKEYVAIGLMKKYISIHFSKYNAVEYIKNNTKGIKCNVGCINIPYNREIEYEIIYKAIDLTFIKQ